jgi:hypothetical protein
MRLPAPYFFATALLLAPAAVVAQDFPTDDAVIRQIWGEGMNPESSQIEALAQALLDSIGPRLSGSPGYQRAVDWAEATIDSWGVEVEREQYGTWVGWETDFIHADLLAPRRRTLEAHTLAWSPGTEGPVEGDVIALPELAGPAEFEAWKSEVEGRFVLLSPSEPTCRAPESWQSWGQEGAWDRIQDERREIALDWNQRLLPLGGQVRVAQALEDAGAAGIITSRWSEGWGVNKIFSSATRGIPSIDVSCEDFGLLSRLAEADQGPRLRLDVAARFTDDEAPVFNVIGRLPGTELPDEYVVISAHLDSWHAASGATDNGSGTVMMMEAMRLLRAAYPNPRRTILLALWGGEEQGLIGSNAFAEDHPEVLDGLQAAFNQDNGTWRVDFIRMQGFTGAGAHFGRWFSRIPREITDFIELDIPGEPERGGSDHMAFICRQFPGFRLQSNYPDYRQYTWHTNRDTYDKLVFEDLRNNATLAAMLAYAASEDPDRVPRDVRVVPEGPPLSGQWPECSTPRRSWDGVSPR